MRKIITNVLIVIMLMLFVAPAIYAGDTPDGVISYIIADDKLEGTPWIDIDSDTPWGEQSFDITDWDIFEGWPIGEVDSDTPWDDPSFDITDWEEIGDSPWSDVD